MRQMVRTDMLRTKDPIKASYLLHETIRRTAARHREGVGSWLGYKLNFLLGKFLRENYRAMLPKYHLDQKPVWRLKWSTDWASYAAQHQRKFNPRRLQMEAAQKDRERRNEPYRNAEAIDRVKAMVANGRLTVTAAGLQVAPDLELKRIGG